MIELEERPCPICKTSDHSVVFRESTYDAARWTEASFSSRKMPEYMHFRLLTCATCSLTYGSPVASPETASEAYREASFEAQDESAHAARTYAKYLRKAGFEPGAALDIGSGDGAFLRELRGLGFREIVGIEPSQAPVRLARDDVRDLIREEMFDGSRFAENTFDLVTCFQTIEHVYEPHKLLQDIYRILKPGGKAFIIAHNLDAFSAKVLGEKSPIFDIEHVQLFTPRSVRFLLERSGFQAVEVFPILNAYPLTYWVKLSPLPAAIKMGLLARLERGPLAALGGMLLPIPAGNMAIFGIK
ncbi:MAG: SAM-dependent methyltransferase [Candidatus Eremiobacteraeota bacterium]|nr:SAM-dependent methyltransferase [Candidatus Eremiobacteraeota bacterium]